MGYNPWCCKESDTTGWLRAFQIERIRCKGHCHFSWAIERGWREERRSGTKAGWSWRLEWRVSSIWRVMKSHMKSLFILKSLFNTYEWGLFSAQWNFAVALACIVLKILLNLHCSLARPGTMSSLHSQSQHIPLWAIICPLHGCTCLLTGLLPSVLATPLTCSLYTSC